MPGKKRCKIKRFSTVLDVALGNKIDLNHSCGGMGSCTTCRVFVVKAPQGEPPKTAVEKEQVKERNFKENERLACQLRPTPGMVIWIPT